MRRVVSGDGAASGLEAAGIRVVAQRGRIRESREDGLRVVMKATFSGIRGGEVEHRRAGGAEARERLGQAVCLQIPIGAISKHFACARCG